MNLEKEFYMSELKQLIEDVSVIHNVSIMLTEKLKRIQRKIELNEKWFKSNSEVKNVD